MIRECILVTLLVFTLGKNNFSCFLSFLTFDFSTVLAKDVDKLDETEEYVTSGDLEEVKETRVARSFPEKSASKVYLLFGSD